MESGTLNQSTILCTRSKPTARTELLNLKVKNTETTIEKCKVFLHIYCHIWIILLKVEALNVDEIMEEILTGIPNYTVEKSSNCKVF